MEPGTSPAAEPPAHPAAAAPGDGREYTTVGPLVVEQQADVVAARDGFVTSVNVEIGDHVRRGEVLALLDDRALEAARAEKAARIDSLKAQVQTWEAEQKSNEADLRRADAMRAEKILDDEDWEHVQYKLTETRSQVARYKAEETGCRSRVAFRGSRTGPIASVSPLRRRGGPALRAPGAGCEKGRCPFLDHGAGASAHPFHRP